MLVNGFTTTERLARFAVPGMVFFLLIWCEVELEDYWLLSRYACLFCTGVMVPCCLLLWFIGIVE